MWWEDKDGIEAIRACWRCGDGTLLAVGSGVNIVARCDNPSCPRNADARDSGGESGDE